IDPDKTVQYYRKPTRSHTVNSAFTSLSTEDAFPLIEIIYSYAGATGKLIEYIVQDGTYQGIIIAGTGAGRFSKKEEKALRSEEHTSELQSRFDLVCRLLLEKKKQK